MRPSLYGSGCSSSARPWQLADAKKADCSNLSRTNVHCCVSSNRGKRLSMQRERQQSEPMDHCWSAAANAVSVSTAFKPTARNRNSGSKFLKPPSPLYWTNSRESPRRNEKFKPRLMPGTGNNSRPNLNSRTAPWNRPAAIVMIAFSISGNANWRRPESVINNRPSKRKRTVSN